MTKWSVVTNIHWKFEGFLACSFGATKVYYLPFRVLVKNELNIPIPNLHIHKPEKNSGQLESTFYKPCHKIES